MTGCHQSGCRVSLKLSPAGSRGARYMQMTSQYRNDARKIILTSPISIGWLTGGDVICIRIFCYEAKAHVIFGME